MASRSPFLKFYVEWSSKMFQQVGIIGPRDSLELILEVGNEFDYLQLNAYPYDEIQEVSTIIQDNTKIQFWLFSGQAPYWYAQEKGLVIEEHSLFIPLVGSGLMRTFIQMVYHNNFDLKRISFDTYLEQEINEIFNELDMTPDYYNVLPYERYMNEEKIIAFHLSEYQEGKTDVAVTCIQAVYKKLLKEKIPVVRVLPTRNVVRQTIELLRQKSEAAQYLKSSIAILTLELIPQNINDDTFYSYKFKRKLLYSEEEILSYAEAVNGSMVRMGDMLYFIFTTRGALDIAFDSNHSLGDWLDVLYSKTHFKTYAGIGYGPNVFMAEKNARLALAYSKQKMENNIFLVDEEGKVMGPLKDNSESYSTRSIDFGNVFEGLKIGPMQWSRVKAYVKQYSKDEVTANQLAEWLNVTDRNARKILNELVKGNLAEIIGEEQPGPKGRPRKVYRIL